jgi:alanine dehydrogenase
MIIAVPKERKVLEKRVAITPLGVKELLVAGHQVLIETKAGIGAGFSDFDYISAGAEIVSTLEEVWRRAELLVKVKEPAPEEYQFCRPGLIIFDYLHLAGLPEVAKVLVDTKVSGIAYEGVQTTDGRLPLLEPMSEIAGKLSVINGANCLLAQNGGSGVLLSGISSGFEGKVGVLGFGVAGKAAAVLADAMGAAVSVIEKKEEKREQAKACLGPKAQVMDFSESNIESLASQADLLIGAVLVPGAAAPRILTKETISKMKLGSVFVDISIDQGGCSETSRTTSLSEPTYLESGVLHYCVPNMPAQVARTATLALTSVTLPYIKLIADFGLDASLEKAGELKKALSVRDGNLIV